MLERCSYVFNYFLADMFKNILGFIKVLPFDFLISDHTRSEISMFYFFPKWTVSTVKGSIFTTIVGRQGGQLFRFVIKEFLGLLKTFQTQDIAFNMWKIVKKIKMLHCCPKSEKCSISAQKSRKCLRELEM